MTAIFRFQTLTRGRVTPVHSTAVGELLTGEKIEVGRLTYEAGEGAESHAHPQEQIFVVVSGRIRATVGDEQEEIGSFEGFHALPNVRHGIQALERSEVLSCKSLVAGEGHAGFEPV